MVKCQASTPRAPGRHGELSSAFSVAEHHDVACPQPQHALSPKGCLCWGGGGSSTSAGASRWEHSPLWLPAPEAGSYIPLPGEAFGLTAAQGSAPIDAPASLNTSQGSMDKAGNCLHQRDMANPPGRALPAAARLNPASAVAVTRLSGSVTHLVPMTMTSAALRPQGSAYFRRLLLSLPLLSSS